MQLPVLMYHKITDNNISCNRYEVTKDKFLLQMQCLSKQGYKSITIEDIENNIIDNVRPVMITFDDGFESDVKIVLPILKQYGLKSVHFIVTDYIGTDGYMDWDQVKLLRDSGCSIQSHTKTHRPLKQLSNEEIKRELTLSKKSIEKETGNNSLALSLPKGSRPENMDTLIRECGCQYVFTSKPDINCYSSAKDIWEFGRVLISDDMGMEDFKKILSGEKTFYYKKQISFIGKQFLKKMMPYNIYYKLWKIFIRKGN